MSTSLFHLHSLLPKVDLCASGGWILFIDLLLFCLVAMTWKRDEKRKSFPSNDDDHRRAD